MKDLTERAIAVRGAITQFCETSNLEEIVILDTEKYQGRYNYRYNTLIFGKDGIVYITPFLPEELKKLNEMEKDENLEVPFDTCFKYPADPFLQQKWNKLINSIVRQ